MSLPGSARRRAPLALAALSAAVAALAACGSDPVAPGGNTGGSLVTKYTDKTPVSGTVARANYRDTLLTFEHAVFYWNDRVNWTAQASSVSAQVNAATTHGGLWTAAEASIDPWLRNAGDEHSAFFPPTDAPGLVDASPDPRNLASGVSLAAPGQPALAYLWMPGFDGRNVNGRVDSIQTVIRTLDQSNPCGWVLDLRRNLGGYTDAMVAGINPIFGDAPASPTQPGYGGEVDRENGRALYFVNQGAAGIYDPDANKAYTFARATTPYTLKRPGSPVAVLTGPATASAAEAITLGFRGSPVPNRSFGEPTYGVTTGPYGTYLQPDSGYLNVTATIMFDRTGKLYGGKLQPDSLVTGGPQYRTITPTPSATDPVIQAASAWLRSQAACTGAPATAGLRMSRAVAPRELPGVVRPLHPGAHMPRVMLVPRRVAERWLAERQVAGPTGR